MATAQKQQKKSKNRMGMIVRLLSPKDIQSVWLPVQPKGKYYFLSDKGVRNDSVYIEAEEDRWTAHSDRKLWIIANREKTHCVALEKGNYYPIINDHDNQVFAFYCEGTDDTENQFDIYRVKDQTEIRIGRSSSNDIVYENPFVSRQHAVLSYSNRKWAIKDLDSLAGVFLNTERVYVRSASLGDVLYIIGLRIIIGTDFIAVSNTYDRLIINEGKLTKINDNNIKLLGSVPIKPTADREFFNRSPRVRTTLQKKQIDIESPPMPLNNNQIPILLRMGSPMVMGASSVMTGNYLPLLSSLLFPLMTNKFTEKQREEYEKKRVEKYGIYLENKKKEISKEKLDEEKLLNDNYPPLSTVLSYSRKGKKLWNRRKTDDDFMYLRVGSGNLPLFAEYSFQKERFELDEDELQNRMYKLAETPVYLENVPITIDLKENPAVGIHGSKELVKKFVYEIILRLSVLYSYDEMKMIFLMDKEDMQDYEYVRNLPHVWDDQRSIRFIASDSSEVYMIGEYIRNQFEDDLKDSKDLKKILKTRPYYVVFALSKKTADSMEILKEILQQENNCGLTLFAIYNDIPKESTALFTLDSSGYNRITYLNRQEYTEQMFMMDPINLEQASSAASNLSNISLKMVSEAYSLPKTLTFLEMFGVGKVEHLNIEARWKESNAISSLAAPVGVGTDGSIFTLDLHQKFQGPHGLVAGMTGSGKSEFLITYILSMAILYHPDEVSFLLIDYKGGGLAGAFDDPVRGIHLPHLVGTITNLDGAAIQRSITSLESEMKRRQREFNNAKSVSAEGTMDIYTYQRLYRNGVVTKPMPHLFIISDEFAELKQQEPEFMDQLISIARIGRSLGVHLILATQKPSGVVNDQIRSNTKFQVCLKVQDKSDSIDMLKRPDAAELKETGRFYLQVGYNEYFALGQSAWSGAPYYPQDEVIVNRDESIQVIDNLGQTVLSVKPTVDTSNAQGTHLTAIVKYMSVLAKDMNIQPRSLWLDPLKDKLDLEELFEYREKESRETINVTLGKMDDPANQKQFPALFDFQKRGNMLVVGEQGSGKTTFIQSLLVSLSEKYTADEVNYYILDYSSNLLSLFEKMPHCGAVLNDEKELYIESFFGLIEKIVADRKTLFKKIEADSFETARQKQPLPLIFVIIDNYAGVRNSKKGNDISYAIEQQLKEWPAYGIRFILTTNHLNETSLRMKQELPYRLALRMKDSYEYGDALETKTRTVPGKAIGRGMAMYEETALELQIAQFAAEAEDSERIDLLKTYLAELASKQPESISAEKLPMFSETENYEEFLKRIRKKKRIPLGYNVNSSLPVTLPLKQMTALTLYLGESATRNIVINNFMLAAQRENMKVWFLKRESESYLETNPLPENAEIVTIQKVSVESFCDTMIKEMQNRHLILEDYCDNKGISL